MFRLEDGGDSQNHCSNLKAQNDISKCFVTQLKMENLPTVKRDGDYIKENTNYIGSTQ